MIKIIDLTKLSEKEITKRISRQQKFDAGILATVKTVVEDVRKNGDKAVAKYTKKFDKKAPKKLSYDQTDMQRAYQLIDTKLRTPLVQAARNITNFQRRMLPKSMSFSLDGATLGVRPVPVDSAGIYVPGGRAAYPSSVLMGCIPAKVAGVGQVYACTPPQEAADIELLLAAGHIAKLDMLFIAGGAQAIAAMAYGTKRIPKADVVVGPGNQFVTCAKKYIYGDAGIDFLAGPSEVLIIADGTPGVADANRIALDLASQAEHGPDSVAIMLTGSRKYAETVAGKLGEIIKQSNNKSLGASFTNGSSAIYIVSSYLGSTVTSAVGFSNRFAPEHLMICTKNRYGIFRKITAAGCVFIGDDSPVVLGDYCAGPNHILPTMGNARFSSALSPVNFMRMIQYQNFTPDSAMKCAKIAAVLAEREGLLNHAMSARARLQRRKRP